MALDGVAEAAEFAEEGDAAVVDRIHRGAAIEMVVDRIGRFAHAGGLVRRVPSLYALLPVPSAGKQFAALPVPAARRPVHEARGVMPAREVEHRVGEKFARLTQALVVGVPHHNRGRVEEQIHHALHLDALELVALHRIRKERVTPVSRAAGQILDEQKAQLVAQVVVAARLHLDVLAHHVVAAILERQDVEDHRLFRGRCEQTVRPPALVKRAEQEDGLVVEEETQHALGVLALFEFPHTEITLHHVFAVGGGKRVELRGFRRPAGKVLRQIRRDLHLTGAFDLVELKAHRAFVDVRIDLVGADVLLGHRLHPHAAHDAA